MLSFGKAFLFMIVVLTVIGLFSYFKDNGHNGVAGLVVFLGLFSMLMFVAKDFEETPTPKTKKIKYVINEQVSFDVALSALKDGYVVQRANSSNGYMIMLNKEIYHMNAPVHGSQSEAYIMKDFTMFEMSMDRWKIYNTSILGNKTIKDYISELNK